MPKPYQHIFFDLDRTLWHFDENSKIHFFEGEIKGTIVNPRGKTDFGWDPIFQPNGHKKTFGEMTKEEKNKISHRKVAVEKLKEHLLKN